MSEEANHPSSELEQLKAENAILTQENQRLRRALLGVLSQIHIGQPVASDGTPLLKIKTINDAEALLKELGLKVRS